MAKYFSAFPNIVFDNRILTDILVRIKAKESWLNNSSIYYDYLYKDSDRPEHIAQKYYGDESLHWIILITNNIFNPFFDFPMPYDTFYNYIEKKYKTLGAKVNLGGLEYAMSTPDPVFRYQKIVRITTLDQSDEKYYVIDKKTYTDLVFREVYSTVKTVTFRASFSEGFDVVDTQDTSLLSVGDILNQTAATSEETFITEIIDISKFRISTLAKVSTEDLRVTVYTPSVTGTTYEILRRYPEVTLFQQEYEENERKRLIKILNIKYVEQAKSQLLTLLGRHG
jgi:hypothetical protein